MLRRVLLFRREFLLRGPQRLLCDRHDLLWERLLRRGRTMLRKRFLLLRRRNLLRR